MGPVLPRSWSLRPLSFCCPLICITSFIRDLLSQPLEEVLWQELKPGHTVHLRNGKYGQVLLPRVEGAPGSVHPLCAVVSVMETAQHSLPESGYHPEFPVPFLKRRGTKIIELSEIKNRAHVNHYFGDLYREHDASLQLFLVNIWGNPRYRGEPHRELFWRCPLVGCTGRMPVPPEGFGQFTCPLCSFSFP